MSTNTAKVKWVSDSQQMQADYDKLHAKQQKTEQGFQRLKKEIRDVSQAGAQLGDGTKKALSDSVTAAEKYRVTMAGLRKELDAGRITEERYNAARRAAQATFKATDPASLAKAAAAAKAASDLKSDAAKKEAEAAKKVAEAERLRRSEMEKGRAITEANRTAHERFAENVLMAKRALDKGDISLETYNRELRRQKDMLKETPGSFATWTASVFTATAAYNVLSKSIQAVIAHERERMAAAADAGKRYDDNLRKFRIQSGQNEAEGLASQRKVLGIAKEVGATPDEAMAAATQLVSADFSADEATGGALRNLLLLQRATGGEASTEELGFSMASYLESQGMKKTGQNILGVGVGLRNITAQSQFKLQQFPDFAKEASAFKGKLSVPEQLAAAAALSDTGMGGAEAGTALRSLVVRSGTADTAKKTEALRKIGLKNTDIDFIGENLDTVLGRLEGGLSGIDVTERESVLKTLYEEQAIAPIKLLMQSRGKLAKYAGGFDDVAGFNKAAEVGTGGVTAGLNRKKAENELQKIADFGVGEAVRQQVVTNRFDDLPVGGAQKAVAETAGIVVNKLSGGRVSRDTTESLFGTDEFGAFNGLGVASPRNIARNALISEGVIKSQAPSAEAADAMRGLKEALDKNTAAQLQNGVPQAPGQPLLQGANPAMAGAPQ